MTGVPCFKGAVHAQDVFDASDVAGVPRFKGAARAQDVFGANDVA